MPEPPRLSAVYLDFSSADCRRVWRWLSATSARERVEVRPFWSESVAAGRHGGPWERAAPTSGLELLALAEFAREHGREAHLRFVDAAFEALGEEAADVSGLEMWLRLGAKAGLDMALFTADVERWRAEVGLWHEEARDELGVRGVPTLVFADRHALQVELDGPVQDPEEAEELLGLLARLSAHSVREVRRTSG